MATVLAIVVGTISLVRFYAHKSNMFLFLGAGFLGTACLDGYHGLVRSDWFASNFAQPPGSLLPLSWLASRCFTATLLAFGAWGWLRERQLGPTGVVSEARVYSMTIVWTLGCFGLFAVAPLPDVQRQGLLGRPEELVPMVLFGAALAGHWRKGLWRRDPFERWVVLSLIAGIVGQATMATSGQLFDGAFMTGHVLKVAQYALVIAGLLANISAVYREVEARAEQSAARYERLFEGVPLGLFRCDSRGHLLEVNARFGQILGARPDAADVSLSSYPTLAQDKGLLQGHLEAGDAVSELIVRVRSDGDEQDPDGGERWVEINARPLSTAAGAGQVYEGSLQDVTLRKRGERTLEERTRALERSNAELDQFAYVASHDLQEPLRTIASFVQLFERRYASLLDETGREYVAFIVEGCTRMQALIADILEYSRVGARRRPRVAVDPGRALDSSLASLDSLIRDTGTVVTRDPLGTVLADESQLAQLFQNLISNAIKFRGPATPRIHVAYRPEDPPVFSVADNGLGIDRDYHERVFGIFERLHRREEFPGTGIGLAICRKVIEGHGGRIWIESEPGVGTTFCFTLPKAPPEPTETPSGGTRLPVSA